MPLYPNGTHPNNVKGVARLEGSPNHTMAHVWFGLLNVLEINRQRPINLT
ncbi:hypothetical protein C7379_10555 [Hallella colorans]|uniref:Uncharacterized protein n=1 Tax=Hallella colorans TaxID=1703337 RepID=A0A2U0UH30_9BACT|nr:hypothetical protein C7379_10555 [Hallella colorans]